MVLISPRTSLFRRNFFAQMFDGNSNYRTCYINSHNLTDRKLLRQPALGEEERSLGNWSDDEEWRHILYYATLQQLLQTILATCDVITTSLTIWRSHRDG